MQTGRVEYLDFELAIGDADGSGYPVTVRDAPVPGRPAGTLRLPFDEPTLKLHLLHLEDALARSGRVGLGDATGPAPSNEVRRRIVPPHELPVQSLGQQLFGALLDGDVLRCYRESRRAAQAQRKGLRLKLSHRDPRLAALPWEFLYDPQRDYLCLHRDTPLVRCLPPGDDEPDEALRVTPPLRILGMVASPEELPALDVHAEQQQVEQALTEVQASGLVELQWLQGQSWAALQHEMMRGVWHVFHFVGHGRFDTAGEESLLALVDEDGAADHVTATQLGRLLAGRELRLVVLNACEGARGGEHDAFSSAAARLVEHGIPAVVAMQHEISDLAAIRFSAAFYAAVAAGMPVDAAVAEGRIAVHGDRRLRESVEWGTPVLYTRCRDGRIFDLDGPPARPAPPAEATQLSLDAWDAHYIGDHDREVSLLEGLVALRPGYVDAVGTGADARARLDEARRARELAQLYDAGKREHDAQNWAKAVEHLKAVVGGAGGGYRDAESLLAHAQRRWDTDVLYARARELDQAGRWAAVRKVVEDIRALDADFGDPDGLEVRASAALEAAARDERARVLHPRAIAHMNAGAWAAAAEVWGEILAQVPDYPGATELLARAEQELARQQAEEQRLAGLALGDVRGQLDVLGEHFLAACQERAAARALQGADPKLPVAVQTLLREAAQGYAAGLDRVVREALTRHGWTPVANRFTAPEPPAARVLPADRGAASRNVATALFVALAAAALLGLGVLLWRVVPFLWWWGVAPVVAGVVSFLTDLGTYSWSLLSPQPARPGAPTLPIVFEPDPAGRLPRAIVSLLKSVASIPFVGGVVLTVVVFASNGTRLGLAFGALGLVIQLLRVVPPAVGGLLAALYRQVVPAPPPNTAEPATELEEEQARQWLPALRGAAERYLAALEQNRGAWRRVGREPDPAAPGAPGREPE